MADKRISELDLHSSVGLSDQLAIVSSNETKRSVIGSVGETVRNMQTPLTASSIVSSGDILPSSAQTANLGSVDRPFASIFVQSGSISIESDTPGDPSAVISNEGGNLEVSVGGMRLVQPGNSFIAETGSFQYISGSLTQQGDYTRFGDTIAVGDFVTTGSIEVSGSVTSNELTSTKIKQNPNSIASGLYSTALGGNGQALGDGSTTVGFSSVAIGSNSFAQGNGTIASSSYQAALGLWNTQGNTKDLVVIGNGNPAPGGRSDLAHFTTSSFEVEGFISASTYYGDGSNLTGIVHPNVNTGSLMVTGSISGTTLTFEKGDSSTFDIEIPTIAGPSGSQGPQGIQGEVGPSGSQGIQGETPDTGSLMTTGSISANTLTFTKGDSSTFDIDLPTTSTGSLVSKAYGSFFDTTTQSGSANTAYAIKHNTTDLSSDVSIVSDTRITMAEAGVYTIISTQQFVHTQGSTVTITGWLRKNGTDVPNSGTDLRLKGNNAKDLYAINYFVSASAGDYYELIWSPTDSDTEIQYTAARTSPTRPAVPSVITTVNRVG